VIAVTGANGYVGGRILANLRAAGTGALALVRRPEQDDGSSRRFALGEPLAEGTLEDVHTVIHAAWDMTARGEQVAAVNVAGSLPLLDALAARGGRALLISSLSAFATARSDYGRAKYALEQAVQRRGGLAVRPGLVFGAGAGGLFGRLAATSSQRPLMPIVGGSERLFVTHDEHLAILIAGLAAAPPDRQGTIFAAHERPTTLRAIVEQIAAARGGNVRLVPIPARAVLTALRLAEAAGLQPAYRSDSLLSLVNPAPLDELSELERPSLTFPALSPDLWEG